MNAFGNFKRKHDFLVCVDSDGCLLSNMELKHMECFCPATVNQWGLQNISRYAREAAEFVNLYSQTRGINRFPGLLRTLDLLFDRPEVIETGVEKPELAPLRRWVESTKTLSAPALAAYCEAQPDVVLERALRWSREVDENIARIVHGIKPFAHVKEALKKLGSFADIVVVSATPQEALTRELRACGIDSLVSVIAGQESGTKARNIARGLAFGYEQDAVLKVGDAPGDLQAALENGVLYYPIIPGKEVDSWKQLRDEASEKLHDKTYKGCYMDAQTARFFAVLPQLPPWHENEVEPA